MRNLILFLGSAVLAVALSDCGNPETYVVGQPNPVTPTSLSSEACTVTANATGSLITCPDGSSSQVLNGITTTVTSTVATTTGIVDGLTGGIAAPVQLCPNNPPTTYPITFDEVGLCIGGNLYGVYDGGANDVFLTLIPPGLYESTSTDAPCNFTVAPLCVVVQD